MCDVRKNGSLAFHSKRCSAQLCLAAVLTGLFLPSAFAAAPPENRQAPPFEIKSFDGAKFSSENTRGKVVLLTFWATWCHFCLEEMPALEKFYRAHHPDGLEVLAINIDDSADLARLKSLTQSYSFPYALISASNIGNYGSISFVPMTFVIDRKGILRKSAWPGTEKINTASLNKYVQPLLRER